MTRGGESRKFVLELDEEKKKSHIAVQRGAEGGDSSAHLGILGNF